jgi:S-adenosyl-L-methionine hydrolase (adenosine-forming)
MISPVRDTVTVHSADRDARITFAFQEFFQLRDNGHDVPISEFVSKYPDLQPELQKQLDEAIDEDSRLGGQELATVAKTDYRGGLETVPSYRLMRPIGRGGYGTVWIAEHTNNTGQFRAVKIIPKSQPDVATEIAGVREAYNRSQQDGSLITRFVLPLDAPGEEDAYWYYLMECADSLSSEPVITEATYRAKTLKNLLMQPGPPEAKDILQIGRDICLALEELHASGCLHRDVKPTNILSVRGKWKLGDLGQLIRHDQCTEKRGTKRYAADASVPADHPLQDLLALLKVMYELLTKDHAFQYLQAFLHDAAPDSGSATTIALRRIIRKGINKGYTTATALRIAIDDALAIHPWRRYRPYFKWVVAGMMFASLTAFAAQLHVRVKSLSGELAENRENLEQANAELLRLDGMGSRLIVLQTDYGSKDHYMAALKGSIYKICPSARIEVITTEIDEFDVFHAAWTLWRASMQYPKGTIFVVVTNPGGVTALPILVTTKNGHIYIGHDNGCFDLVVQHYQYESGFRLSGPNITPREFKDTFGGVDLFGPAAARLFRGDLQTQDCGTRLPNYVSRLPGLRHEVQKDRAIGSIMDIDRFGNATTNITQEDIGFMGVSTSAHFVVDFAGKSIHLPLKATYGHVSKKSEVAILYEDLLQLAVNEGNFAKQFHLKRGQTFTLELENESDSDAFETGVLNHVNRATSP